jgi:hypothetical protein
LESVAITKRVGLHSVEVKGLVVCPPKVVLAIFFYLPENTTHYGTGDYSGGPGWTGSFFSDRIASILFGLIVSSRRFTEAAQSK